MLSQRPGQPYKPTPLTIPRPDGIGAASGPRGTTMGELRAMLKLQRAARETAKTTPRKDTD